MLVSEYVIKIVENRPYKYSTKQTNIRDIKKLGIWDLELDEITSGLIRSKVETFSNQNTRKRLFITARSMFRDLGICQDLPYLEGSSRIYDIPSQEDLEWIISRSKYKLQLFLCMFAGLRVGEACAVTPDKLQGDYLDVNQAYSQDGLHLGSPKTYGKVLLPAWLADQVRNMTEDQTWYLGKPTKDVTNSCYKLARNSEWKKRTGGKNFNPHMLRHWYATDMIRRGVNPEIVRRQMRHKNVSTTLRIYTQVRSDELTDSLPQSALHAQKPSKPSWSSEGNIIHFEFGRSS